ncbi:AMP-binding protein [Herbiconiux ginsengi]|uniref:Propionyl-CoA synthetase n=1 Tax=Herbiconiux ginsengi TaxID=381665 RepID=A0A1H3TBY4_9MICO|nr:AMP-binding protein [Herbiconiux ginsengi]SDZ47734.1 propionyl-CoA synthetase [Herbiconiux ginsengi]
MTDSLDRFHEQWRTSIDDRDRFWLEQSKRIDWSRAPRTAIEDAGDSWSWFPDGELNLSYNTLDRHIEAGRGDAAAVIFDSAMTSESRTYTYHQLRDETAIFAGVLREQGVRRGERVIIYMPMIPEAVVAMLACARIGAVHSVVFGGFAANELATRIVDAGARILVMASGGLEPGKVVDYVPLVREALRLSDGAIDTVILKERDGFPTSIEDVPAGAGATWLDWSELAESANPAVPVPIAANDPLYLLYTSGTTGNPKGIVRDSGGYAVALDWSMRNIYGAGPGDVFWTASDVGWVVGHSYIVYAPLLIGATTVLYEGKPVGTPDAGAFWRVVEQHRVNVMFTAPTAIRAIHRIDPDLEQLARYDRSSLRALFLAGERLDPETYQWITAGLGVPVIDHWWQTETGWAISANPVGFGALPLKAGSSTVPMAGYDVAIVNSKGREVETGREGNIAIRLPLPPGTLTGVWGGPHRLRDSYLNVFPGYYATGDSGYFDNDGYLFVMGRTDDVINVAGHRLSTGALEEVIALHHDVAECAVVGVRDALKGQRAMGFVSLKSGRSVDESELRAQLVDLVRTRIGPVAAFRDVMFVDRLPKTRSGKILRKTLRQIIDGEPYRVPATIEDTSVLDPILAAAEAARAPII